MFLAIVIYKFIIVLLREKVKHEAKNKKFTRPHPPPFFNTQPPRLLLRCLPSVFSLLPLPARLFLHYLSARHSFSPPPRSVGGFSFAFFNFLGLFAKSRHKSVSRHPSPSQKQGKTPYAVRENRIFQPYQKCPKSVKFHAVF